MLMEIPLGEIATLIKGYSARFTPLENPDTQYLVLKTINTPIVDPANNYPYTFNGKDISKYLIQNNDIIFESIGTAKVGIVITAPPNTAINANQTIIRLTNKDILPKYLLYYLNTKRVIKLLKPVRRGSVQSHIKLDDLKKLSIPIISLDQQKKWIDLNQQVGYYKKLSYEAIEKLEVLPDATLNKLLKNRL